MLTVDDLGLPERSFKVISVISQNTQYLENDTSYESGYYYQLEKKTTINDTLPLKATRSDAIAKLKSLFGVSNLSCRQTQCRFFHLDLPWYATLMPLGACVNSILRVGKNSGSILSRLWKFWDNVGSSSTSRHPWPIVYMSCFVQKIFAIKSQSYRKTEQM